MFVWKGGAFMLYLLGRKGDCYILKNDFGEEVSISAGLLKAYMRDGLKLSNAHLSEGGRLLKNKPLVKQKELGYTRTPEIARMSLQEKYRYYTQVILNRSGIMMDLSVFTIDELDAIVVGCLELETADRGSSNVDMALERNINCYPTLRAVNKEVVRRGYLTEEELRKYYVGMENGSRVINKYSFAQWIIKNKKY